MGHNLTKLYGHLKSSRDEVIPLSKAFILRKIIHLTGAKLSSIEKLSCGEHTTSVKVESTTLIAPNQTLQIAHPRDDVDEIHSFNSKYLYTLQNVVLDTLTGIAFSSDGKIIEESSSWPKAHLLLNSIPKPPKRIKYRIKNANTIVLPSNGFYHWLIEDLPTFIGAYHNINKPHAIMYKNAFSYVKNLANLFSSVELVPRYVVVDNYSFISKGPDTGWPHPEEISALRGFFEENIKLTNPGKRVYISRVNSTRSPIFELTLTKILIAAGWKVLETQYMSLQEQVSELSSAAVICGVHGAGLSGLIWMAPGSKVIELSPPRVVPCFSRMSQVCGHRYFRVPIVESLESSASNIFSSIESFANKP